MVVQSPPKNRQLILIFYQDAIKPDLHIANTHLVLYVMEPVKSLYLHFLIFIALTFHNVNIYLVHGRIVISLSFFANVPRIPNYVYIHRNQTEQKLLDTPCTNT